MTDALHSAAAAGDGPALEALLAQGTDVDAQDECGRSPLHLASAGGHDACVQVCIDARPLDACCRP